MQNAVQSYKEHKETRKCVMKKKGNNPPVTKIKGTERIKKQLSSGDRSNQKKTQVASSMK